MESKKQLFDGLVEALYTVEIVGGLLHVVVDDINYELKNVIWSKNVVGGALSEGKITRYMYHLYMSIIEMLLDEPNDTGRRYLVTGLQ